MIRCLLQNITKYYKDKQENCVEILSTVSKMLSEGDFDNELISYVVKSMILVMNSGSEDNELNKLAFGLVVYLKTKYPKLVFSELEKINEMNVNPSYLLLINKCINEENVDVIQNSVEKILMIYNKLTRICSWMES